MTPRENYLAAAEYRGPQWIPHHVYFLPATWHKYRQALEEVVLRHPRIFPGFQPGSVDYDAAPPAYRAGEIFTDNWGVVWQNTLHGLEGRILHHPLADWAALETYRPPDPLTLAERGPRGDWEAIERHVRAARERGELTVGGVDRTFERLHFLRGYENFLVDLITEPPQLPRLLEMVLEHNLQLVHKWLSIGVDVLSFGDDLGNQDRAMMRPEVFRKWLKPLYAAMWLPARQAGTHVYFHCDGHITELIPDLIDAGVTILNPQDVVNGLETLRRLCQGKICLNLDIDRQGLLPYGTPEEVRAHIRRCIDVLHVPGAGGLMLQCEIGPDVPLANLEAVCTALEDFCYDI
jgi:hypothetical protein